MTQKASMIPSELIVRYIDSEDISDKEPDGMTDHEISRMGMVCLEISPDNFSEDELARLEVLEGEDTLQAASSE